MSSSCAAERPAIGHPPADAEPSRCRPGPGISNYQSQPGLREALTAVRAGDTLVVTKLDRLARSLPDARDIIEDLTKRTVKLSIG
ncbi:hypothetical protein GCM10023063_22230 [Arthrobacter methylotrophus]